LGLFKRIKDWNQSRRTNSKAIKPVIEKLEPRILLSADGLLGVTVPELLQDPLLDNTQEVIQYTELSGPS